MRNTLNVKCCSLLIYPLRHVNSALIKFAYGHMQDKQGLQRPLFQVQGLHTEGWI